MGIAVGLGKKEAAVEDGDICELDACVSHGEDLVGSSVVAALFGEVFEIFGFHVFAS